MSFAWRGRRVRIIGCADSDIGGKARNLVWLDKVGARVPTTWVVCDSASLVEIIPAASRFAVRSSSPVEDGLETAHAGEFLTLLDVDPQDVPAAMEEVLGASDGADAVVVQRMIDPVASGVVFSRDPVTGLSDIVVEAIQGRGDVLLSGGANPLRWVSRNGAFVESPDGADDLGAVVSSAVSGAAKLGRKYGRPADLEWVWDGKDLWWVQIRPITAIENVPIYSRRISKDVMPGMIKPLVWSINVPMVNTAWVRLITEAIGPNDIDPKELADSYAYRAYFDMRVFGDIFEQLGMPRDSLETLLGLPGEKGRMRPGMGAFAGLPRLVALGWRLRRGLDDIALRRIQLQELFMGLSRRSLEDLSDSKLVGHIREIEELGVDAAYLNIVVPLQANLYTAWLRKRLQSWAGLDLRDMDPPPKGEWDLTPALDQLRASLDRMAPSDRSRALEGRVDRLDQTISDLLNHFLRRFGHLSESVNDISVPRWREEPSSVLMLAMHTDSAPANGSIPWSDVEGSLGWLRRARFRRLRERVEHLLVLREAVGSTFTYGYGLLRPGFLELGRRLEERGIIEAAEDVFFVTEGEVIDALLGVSGQTELQQRVGEVKRDMEEVADTMMPDTIIGDHWIPVSGKVTDRLQGVGTSRGRYRGKARYVRSIFEAGSLQSGDVLVIEKSDVAWTPIFSKAGAVITEAGGLLAHSSITAREMGLPCVASVPGARRLDGATVLVDGSTGEVFLEDPS